MKLCKKSQVIERKNADNCVVSEYSIEDESLDFAIVRVNGRYPESGLAVNKAVKEIVYVGDGSGAVQVNGNLVELNQGDVILIERNEPFYWEGNLTLYIACTPKFSVEQHQRVADSD